MHPAFVTPGILPSTSKRPLHRNVTLVCNVDVPSSPTRRQLLTGLALAPFSLLSFPSDSASESLTRSRERDRLYDVRSGSFVPASAIAALMRRDVGEAFNRCIVAGEIHDNVCTHVAQLAVIDSARRLPDARPLTVGFEQFYRMHDAYLKDYVQGELSMNGLLKKTRWDETWGFDARLYIPIFEYCRVHRIPMVGLNLPIQFVRQVSNYGLEGLPEGLKQFLPDNIDVGNEDHYRHFTRLMGVDDDHFDVEKNNSALGRYYQAQVLWEEWMSQSVAMSLKERPDTRMVALIGSGHVEGRLGFPDRIEKRCDERPYTVVPRPVSWTSDYGHAMPDILRPERDVADLVWYTRRRIDLV